MNIAFLRAAALSLAALIFAPAAYAETQTFDNPKVGANPLDLCFSWGDGCGKPAADAWCVNNGFDESVSHAVAADIGLATPTRIISNGAVCDQAFCDGIVQVTCSRPDPETEVYNKPKVGNKRMDYCLSWGVDCGAPAANEYCQRRGWVKSIDFVIDENIGDEHPTKILNGGQLCSEEYCDGFKTITCSN